MMTGRLFSWNNVMDFFHNRRGSASIWLIAAICFVIVFLGIVFLLSENEMTDWKPPAVPVKSEAEIRKPIKSYTVSNKVPVETENPDQKLGVMLEKELPEKPDQQIQEPLNADPSRIQDVFPEDPPGKGVLAQDLNKQKPAASPEARKTPEAPSSLPSAKQPLLAENSNLTHKQLNPRDEKPTPASPAEVSASSGKTTPPPLSKAKSASPKSGKKGVIQGSRTVVTDPDHAQIIFELNGYYPPEIMIIEGEVPRIVCDFFSVRLTPGVKKNFTVKTGIVKRVRVGVHKGSKPKIRVVLDFNAGQNYGVEQFFFEKENYYALMVNSAK